MLRRTLLLFSVFSLVLGCSDSSGPGRGVTGTWRLQTVNGLQLPFTLPDSPVDKIELTGEVMTLVAPKNLSMMTSFRVTDGSNIFTESIPDAGVWTVEGSTITITWESDGTTSTAIVNGDTMTLEDIGLTFVYRRD